ncbi:MAG: MYG1 family protein, partial [Patescibacteria group bacterium]
TDRTWSAKAIRTDPKTFNNRKDFPKPWAGLRDQELQEVTGVSDALFCHKGLFMAVAKSQKGAIKLAQIAVESKE